MAKKRIFPEFLKGIVSPETYDRWLIRKASAHVRRDRRRGYTCSLAAYRDAIHHAVIASGGRDAYTGEELDWRLISTYKNEESEKGRHAYKAGFALLPTVDHAEAGVKETDFVICGWRTNDAKNDMSITTFLELCCSVLRKAGFKVQSPE